MTDFERFMTHYKHRYTSCYIPTYLPTRDDFRAMGRSLQALHEEAMQRAKASPERKHIQGELRHLYNSTRGRIALGRRSASVHPPLYGWHLSCELRTPSSIVYRNYVLPGVTTSLAATRRVRAAVYEEFGNEVVIQELSSTPIDSTSPIRVS